jgi:hypothetical protein
MVRFFLSRLVIYLIIVILGIAFIGLFNDRFFEWSTFLVLGFGIAILTDWMLFMRRHNRRRNAGNDKPSIPES